MPMSVLQDSACLEVDHLPHTPTEIGVERFWVHPFGTNHGVREGVNALRRERAERLYGVGRQADVSGGWLP